MPEDIRIWQILAGDQLKEVEKSRLDLEERIENWLAKDITILSEELLVIGRQVATEYGGYIDLLCVDREGNLVVVELKRDITPREITAQVLDYASWVKDLSNGDVTEIAEGHLGGTGKLDEAFRSKFRCDLPDVINGEHKMLIVGSEIDSSSERIIKYLSETYGVSINAATFQYFRRENGEEFLARVYLVAPSQVEEKSRAKGASKRAPNLSFEQLQEIADRNGVGVVYQRLREQVETYLGKSYPRRTALTFAVKLGESTKAVLTLIPVEKEAEKGLRFQAYTRRLADYLGIDESQVVALLPEEKMEWKYANAPAEMAGYTGFFKTVEDVNRLVVGLKQVLGAP